MIERAGARVRGAGAIRVLSIVLWAVGVAAVAVLSFAAGVAFGRGFWRDVAWIKARR